MQNESFRLALLVCALAIPAVVLALGLLCSQTGGPRRVNPVWGYRTPLSVRSPACWRFAHRYLGRWWLAVGGVQLAGAAALAAFGRTQPSAAALGAATLLLLAAQTLLLLAPVPPTQRALRTQFDDAGQPITPLAQRLSAGAATAPSPAPAPAAPPADLPADPPEDADEPDPGPEPEE